MKTKMFNNIITIKLVLLIFSSCLNGQKIGAQKVFENKLTAITSEQTDLVNKYFNDFPNNSEVSIGFIKNGTVQFYGAKRISDTLSVVDNHNSIFGIGSISKVFTATLLANMIVNNQLNLNDNISKDLDFPFNENISWLHLANHTSGFPRLPSNLNLLTMDIENPYKDYGEKELKEYLTGKIKLLHQPGKKYAYSNLGAGLLSYLLSQKYNSTYEQLLNDCIFLKLKMNNSTTKLENIKSNLTTGQDAFGKTTPNWDFDALQGAGAILSTVEDLSKFAIAQFDNANEAFNLTRKRTFSINDNLEIGLGWHILKKENNIDWYWHNGATGGYTASMAIDPLAKNGVIILSNVSAFHTKMGNIDELCFGLMNTFYK